MSSKSTSPTTFDVVIIGGALAGAATAIQLLDARPGLRVLVIERSEAFDRRVGEATVELSTYFLNRVLGLADHLNEHHLVKQGLRFWFANGRTTGLDRCSEIGGRYQVRLSAYLIDRAVLDEEVLRRAVKRGATLWRPAVLKRHQLKSGGPQELEIAHHGETTRVQCRWLVDASGVHALLARKEGWHRPNLAHPTTAAWARWRGVKNWDSEELAAKFPAWATATFSLRNTATNHLMGDGWWAWWIPLKGGDVSIGVVWDHRRVDVPDGASIADRIKSFLCAQHPAARELMSEARPVEGDSHWRRQLAWSPTTSAGDGFVLVGDAAGFMDPFYSPGLDWLAFTTARAVQLISAQQTGEPQLEALVQKHNRDFARSYGRWFEALYRDKYDYLGDFELMRLSFLPDLGLYYLGIVTQPYYRGREALLEPCFTPAPSTPFFHYMRLYNRRLAAIARSRRARGTFGRRNTDRRFLFKGFNLQPGSVMPILVAFLGWMRLELAEGWRTWFSSSPTAVMAGPSITPDASRPASSPMSMEAR
ncbi:MAG TPA: NAD(P)/FAD-dependent oxidoreductase [Verrucomicrobiales bacterium]|nr:NAD(P)/FAD-dependent oxidoreductase [Verrucomicrobiales bacterium]